MKIDRFSLLLISITFFGGIACSDQRSSEREAQSTEVKDSLTTSSSAKKEVPIASDTIQGAKDISETTENSEDTTLLENAEGEDIQQQAVDSLETLQSRSVDVAFSLIPPKLEGRIKPHEIPTETAVGIKSYPNAYVIKLNPQVEYAGKKYVTMELATPDKPEEVLKFYQQWKESWFYVEGAGVYTFKKDQEKYFRETNTLQILAFDKALYTEIDTLLPFKAQSLIRIYYEAKK